MKSHVDSPTIVEESPVEEIVQVACIERRHVGSHYHEPSWSGHRLLVIRSGRLRLETSGRICEIGPGEVAWFHGNELVQGRVTEGPWSAYSILFHAPHLPPPDFEARVLCFPRKRLFAACEELLETWLQSPTFPFARLFRVQARLMRLLADLITPAQRALHISEETALWWEVEQELRKDLRRFIDLPLMSRLSHSSPWAITRSCRRAVGVPPLKRVRQIRMSLARSLVWMSSLTFTHIAELVGHGRLHEFSRAYQKHFGTSPTLDRERFARQHGTIIPSLAEAKVHGANNSIHEWPKKVAASPIRKIVFAARFEIRDEGHSHKELSFPGHNIQLTNCGRVRIGSCGREYEAGPGGIVWFHNDEEFSIHVRKAPWTFCNVSFIAPSLPPPDFAERYQAQRARTIMPIYDALFDAWTNLGLPPLVRVLRVQAALLEFLAALASYSSKGIHVDQEAALWWQVEADLRKNLHRPVSLRLMSQIGKCSPTTITRACRKAVATSPRKRVKEMRMQMARGLIWMSPLSFKEIAFRVGYARVQELSRDYHKRFGLTPTQDRKVFPTTYRRVFRLPYTTGSRRN